MSAAVPPTPRRPAAVLFVDLDDFQAVSHASTGGTLAVPGDTPGTLLHRADTAVYTAECDGKDHVELHTPPASDPDPGRPTG
jgi:GGDEF domain-containing protein